MPARVLLKRARACRPGTVTRLRHMNVRIRKLTFFGEFAAPIDVRRPLVACAMTQRSLQQNNQTLKVGQNGNVFPCRFGKSKEQSIGGQPMADRRFSNAGHLGLKGRQVLEREVVACIDL